ncbi:kelch domain-containing protein 7A [Betta splendens]|uniref:Kelch domain-containing protein 7A n=1 Tax=Betta splendens TaxID=158456 RepID=A0A6P7MI45_BETSP|nr:kelch domain-containing protein 7A [Betta splendens]
MPIAELLGVQVDMQLLLKLGLSVAAVLLVSWAYRFHSSREAEKTQVGVEEAPHASDPRERRQRSRRLDVDPDPDDPTRDRDMPAESHPHPAENCEDAVSSSFDQDIITKAQKPSRQTEARVATSHIPLGSALNLPDPAEKWTAATTGRRSPCLLQKLEGSMGVGRELRQDLECQGAYSSFLSKAEIKVEDAQLVLEGRGDQIVHGKIYDYYVESSSQSITESKAAPGQYERNAQSPPAEFGSRGSSLSDSLSSLSPIIMRDLVDRCSAGSQTHPARPVLLRKQSYLSAAEQCELPGPPSTPMTDPLASSSEESISVQTRISPSTDRKDLMMQEGPEAASVDDVESLKRKLDLGNCLEMLTLAKKNNQTAVQQAALRVMSDNYLHVLKEPGLYGRLMADERENIQKQRMRGRRFVMVADMDPQDWARNAAARTMEPEQKGTSSAVYYYDDYKDSWHTLCVIPQEVVSKACAMCTMDNYLFVALGCQGTHSEMTPSRRVFCYNPLTSIWKEISPMNEARPRCKLAALDGCIYAIGGECLSSVERYDPRADRWAFVAPLPNDTFAVAHHVAVCGGELFVSGGSLRCMLLRYSPRSNAWRAGLLAGSRDRTADLVAVGPFLYRFDVNPLLGVGAYRYHTVARLWYECSSKRLQRCPAFQCVALDNAIYCVSRQFTMRFEADEVSPGFSDDDLSVLSAAKGILFPFVLSLPDKRSQQTSV